MEDKTIKILLIEDNPDDAELIRRKLVRNGNGQFMVTPVRSLKEGLEQLDRDGADLILSDLGLPDSHGLDTVTKILCEAPHIPLVVLSGFDDEAIAIKAVQCGAQDYLVKGQMEGNQLERALFYAIERSRMQRELEQHTQELVKIQASIHKILEKNADAIVVVNRDRQTLFVNPAAESLFGYKKKELMKKPFAFPLKGGRTSEIDIDSQDGGKIVAEMRMVDIDWEGEPAYLASLRDVTERKLAEKRIEKAAGEWRVTFDSISDWVSIHDKDCKFIRVNRSLSNAFNKDPSEIIGKTCYQLIHGRGKPVPDCPHMKAISSKKPVKAEVRLHNPGIYAEISVSPIFDDEGNVIATVHITKDITERKRAEAALRESEEKFSKAFLSSPDVVSITALKDGRFIEVNDTFTRATGYSRGEVIGRISAEIGIWAKAEDRGRMVRMLREQGRISNEEFDIRMKSGEIRAWLLSVELINIGGEPCLITVAIDVTELKRAVAALEESEEFSTSLLENAPNPITVINPDTSLKYVNPAFEKLTGFTAAEIVGRKAPCPWWPEESKEAFAAILPEDRVYNGLRIERIYQKKNGERFWVALSLAPVRQNGKLKYLLSSWLDISEKKLAEEALRQSEEKYRTIFENTGTAMAIIEKDCTISMVNGEFSNILGYTREELEGKVKWTDFVTKDDLEKMLNFHTQRRAEDGNVPREYEFTFQDRSKRVKNASIIVSMIPELQQSLVSITDITERKRTEEKLRQIDQMKSEFLSSVSHELRTPLQSISGFAKLILRGEVPDPGTQQEFLQIIDSESQHLGNLINSLLDMSRLESGQFQINKRLLQVRDTIMDALKSFHSLAREKNILLNEDIPELPEIEADGDRLRQVVINLLSNAIKFSDPGGSITVKAERRSRELLFQVTDQGIGITEEALPHLFERFYRAEDRSARGGAGLGLYISKQIIEAHGGRIWAESQVGKGSTLSFTLPLNGNKGDSHG